jgi:hypothetical protein
MQHAGVTQVTFVGCSVLGGVSGGAWKPPTGAGCAGAAGVDPAEACDRQVVAPWRNARGHP